MSEPHEPFGPPREWCDRRCERCPLAAGCAVAVRERGRRWAHTMRGRDPDDGEVIGANMAADLELALELLREIEAELPPADEVAAPPSVVSLVGRQLEESAATLVNLLSELDDHARDVLGPIAVILSTKAARVGCHVSLGALEAVWDHDAAPNVLLLDHQRVALRAALASLDTAEPVRRALERFEHVLDPLVARAEAHRGHLDALVAAGNAPSPFCIVPAEPER